MSSYRNLRFGFDGCVGDAAVKFLLLPMLLLFSFMLAFPWVRHEQHQWVFNHMRYGKQSFKLTPAVGKWYVAYLCAFGGLIGLAIGAIILFGIGIVGLSLPNKGGSLIFAFASVMIYLVTLLGYLTILRILGGWIHKLIFDRLSIGSLQFKANYRVRDLFSLHVVNAFALLFSLGLAYPWIRVRTTRYMVENLCLYAPEGLSAFTAAEQAHSGAAGEEIANMFDVDIGL